MAPGSNTLPFHGNEKTMNLNPLVLANIQASPYFKLQLYELKTYHQVIDEIYYKVNHLEPWEKGSRKVAGQTGMCGGVRGVGTGGIVSSAFCLLYKLYTLKLTHRQVVGLCTHADSPFIRSLGLMYIRYTVPPDKLWPMFEPYLDDEEEVDPKAGGGNNITIGQMTEDILVKLEWYGTLFPRIPVPTQKEIERKLKEHRTVRSYSKQGGPAGPVAAAGPSSREEDVAMVENRDEIRSFPPERSRIRSTERSDSRPQKRSRSNDINGSRPTNRNRSPEINGSRLVNRIRSPGTNGSRPRNRSRSADRRRNEKDSCRSKDRSKDMAVHRSRDRSRDRSKERMAHRSRERLAHKSKEGLTNKSRDCSRDRSADKYKHDERKGERKQNSVDMKRSRSRSQGHKKKHKKHKHDKKDVDDDYNKNLQKELERIKKTD